MEAPPVARARTRLLNASPGTHFNPEEASARLRAGSGPAWNAVASSVWTIEAILLYLNGRHGPAKLRSDPGVEAVLAQLRQS